MDSDLNHVKRIATHARFGEIEFLQACLKDNPLAYRDAMLYCENVLKDFSASKLIYENVMCDHGGFSAVADKWVDGKPICASCSFEKAMSKVEYGKSKQA